MVFLVRHSIRARVRSRFAGIFAKKPDLLRRKLMKTEYERSSELLTVKMRYVSFVAR